MVSTDLDNVYTVDKSYISFSAGKIKHLHIWKQLTSDRNIIEIVTGIKIEFIKTPVQTHQSPQTFNGKEMALIKTEVAKLVAKTVLVVSHEPDEFLSSIFLRKKEDNTYRLIVNLKQLNEFIAYHHFKMDNLQAAIELMQPGCFMASVDLKDAYYSVPVHKAFQKYIKFMLNGNLYQYTCLQNGLSSAPRLSTKLMKPVYSELRRQGHANLGYIDDSLLYGDTVENFTLNVEATRVLMESLGFTHHLEKSMFIRMQVIVFWGFILNSISMTVTPAQDKILKSKEYCLSLLSNHAPTIQELAEVIGIIVANFPANYMGQVRLSQISRNDLHWWVDNIALSCRHIIMINHQLQSSRMHLH